MRFVAMDVPGAFLIELDHLSDERGFFARTFDAAAFDAAGAPLRPTQSSIAYNHRAGTIRGMHWQDEPSPETKLVRCTRGGVLDVLIDRRPESLGSTVTVELSAENRRMLYVPPLVAHGYQTLVDDTELTYDMEGDYDAGAARGVRYDDPAFGVVWPLPVTLISERDRSWELVRR